MAMSRKNFNANKNDDDQKHGAQSACAQDDQQNRCVCDEVAVDSFPACR
jgi:hypothetical protein